MLMPTDPAKQPKLPQHDWAEKHLYVTPTAFRFSEKRGTGTEIDGKYGKTVFTSARAKIC